MTLITSEQERENFNEDFKRIKRILAELEEQLDGLRQQVRTGEVDTVKEANKTLAELRTWSRAAMETEKTLDEYLKRESGIEHGGYALDLAEARRQVGCRLARIAPCCKANRVAE